MAKDFFDLSILTNLDGVKLGKDAIKLSRGIKARRVYNDALARYDHETAEAAASAVRAGRNPQPIFERADRLRKERQEREALLASPPPLHGSARWASLDDLGTSLRGREVFDDPRSILLGAVVSEQNRLAGFLHWDDDGHLMTLAPTRTGKAVTTIIPNLLRYQGSCVVFDPKGELYRETSRWRSTLGPVYRIAPFDTGRDPRTRGWVSHSYNPLAFIERQSDARALADLMLPKDPRSPAFFNKDGAAFLTALIQYLLEVAPPPHRTIRSIVNAIGSSTERFKADLVEPMARSPNPAISGVANNVLGKSSATGLPNLRDTLQSEMALWSDEGVLAATDFNEVDFRRLKDETATVYVEVPFNKIDPYAPVFRVILQAALDAMIQNPNVPDIPVLFVLDEFLALQEFPKMQAAIRTHAGAGVRLWFFLQDLGTLQQHYPGASWQAFFNCSVKQFFGTDEFFTAELISKQLSNRTVAYRGISETSNLSSNAGADSGSYGFNSSTAENITFMGRPLMTPEEVIGELSAWQPGGTRHSIVRLRNPPHPIRVRLSSYENSPICMQRRGALIREGNAT